MTLDILGAVNTTTETVTGIASFKLRGAAYYK
jgi:hypothetical protein